MPNRIESNRIAATVRAFFEAEEFTLLRFRTTRKKRKGKVAVASGHCDTGIDRDTHLDHLDTDLEHERALAFKKSNVSSKRPFVRCSCAAIRDEVLFSSDY